MGCITHVMRRAFALLPVLTLAALCVAVACLCVASARLAGVQACLAQRALRARLTAIAAARLGVGALAQAAGPDRRWTGDIDGVTWVARRTEDGIERAFLRGSFADGGGAGLAWAARDLSCAVDVVSPLLARERAPDIARLPRMRQRLASGATQPPPTAGRLAAAWADDAAGVLSSTDPSVAVGGVRNLLIDPVDGAWRANASVQSTLGERWGGDLAGALLRPATGLREQPARGMEPIEVGAGSARLRHMPVVTELALSLGVFNARSDGRHRVRLHAEMTLWNPSSLPMLSFGEKRMFLAEIEGAPEVTVVNLDSGARLSTWLDQCPPGVFWAYTQGPRERGLWWWVEVLDVTRHGMQRAGILPGEVYALLMPDPVAQPYGLARVIGRGTWRYDPSEHPPGWVRPSPEVFLPSDRIAVMVRFVTPGTTLRLHPYGGPLDASTEAADYGTPSWLTLAHIPWPDARIELLGSEYSRPDSNGYVIGERRFCWRARLVAPDDDTVRALAADPGFMGGRVDLSDPAERERWRVTADAAMEATASSADEAGVLRDVLRNRHEALVDGAYDDWRFREVPVDPPMDASSLRFLQGASPSAWMADLDRVFFACPDTDPLLARSENPRLAPWRAPRDAAETEALALSMRGPDAAGLLALEGAFNIHATDPVAWEAMLSSDPVDLVADTGGPAPPGHIQAAAAFFTQPTGAMLAKYGSAERCDLDDDSLGALPTESRARLARRQSVRAPARETLRRFCACLCASIRARAEPFDGVGGFLASGLVDKAIEDSGLNEGIPSGSPLRLDGPGLLGAHLPLLVARGDTFAVVGEARMGDARIALELTVQRRPESSALPHLGRRFVVTRARWLGASAR